MLLPPVTDPEQCAELRRDPAWVERVCAYFETELDLTGPAVVYPTGSGVSARFGDVVLKLFFPTQAPQATREASVHSLLCEQLSLETPRLVEQGSNSGWPWLLTSVVGGNDLGQMWPTLDQDTRVGLGRQIGLAVKELHAQRPPGDLAVTWPVWSRVQVAGAIDRHRRGGCPETLLAGIDAYLARADLGVGQRGIGLVHTAVRPEHLVVQPSDDGWALTGLIGFANPMVAPVDYEFGPIGVDLARGDRAVLGAILEAYGIEPDEPDLPARLFAMALIHSEADLGGWLARIPDRHADDLDALAHFWFSV